MKILTKILFTMLFVAILLCGLAGCGILFPQSTEKPPDSKATEPLVGEFITEGGSRLIFIDNGGSNRTSGDVLVKFASDAECLLEGRENNAVYCYSFSYHNIDAQYDVAERFELYDGETLFAGCNVILMNGVNISFETIASDGERIVFERAAFTKED